MFDQIKTALQKKRNQALLVVAVTLPVFMAFHLPGSDWYVREFGVNLSHEGVIDVLPIKGYYQRDARFKDLRLGTSRFTIERHGCLASLTASALNYFGVPGDLAAFNRQFSTRQIYNSEGEIIWQKLSEHYPLSLRSVEPFGPASVAGHLKQGHLPVVMVKTRVGTPHWLMITGADAHSFLAVDPLQKSGQPVRLADYGPVYRYRLFSRR